MLLTFLPYLQALFGVSCMCQQIVRDLLSSESAVEQEWERGARPEQFVLACKRLPVKMTKA
jgi:hypothetical protein